MAKGDIQVQIKGNYNDKDINRAIRDLNALKTQAGATAGPMAGLGKTMLAAGAGFFAVGSLVGNAVDFLQDAAKAAIEDQRSVVALSKALDNLGLAHSQAGVEKFIGELQLATGVADTDLRPAYQKLVTATGSVTKAQDLLTLSMDISAATGKDLAAVSQAMGRASLGQVSALTRLGVPLDANIIKTKDFAAAQDVLTAKFGGQAAAAAETYEGKVRRLSVALDEAREQVGYALVAALDDAAASFGGPDGIIPMVTLAGDVTADLVGGIGVLVGRLAELAAAGKGAATDGGNELGDSLSNASQMALTLVQFVPGLGQAATVGYAAAASLIGLGQEAGDAAEQMGALAESANGGDVALAKAALGMGQVARAAYDAAVDTEALNDAIKDYLGLLSLSQAQDDFSKDLADLGKTLDGNKASFRGMGDAAKENRDVLRASLGDAARIVQQMVDEGKISAGEARATFAQMRRDIIDGFVRQGFSRRDVRAFINAEGAWSPVITATAAAVGDDAAAAGRGVGKDLAGGIMAGLRSTQSALNAVVRQGIRSAEQAGRDEARSQSPSLLFAELGEDLSKGIAKGLKDGEAEVVKAAADIIGKAFDAAKQSRDSAMGAVRGVSDGILGQVLGGVNFSTSDAEGNALTPEQMIASWFGSIADRRQVVDTVASYVGTTLPPELVQQLLNAEPAAAMAMAKLLGADNGAMAEQLTLAYDSLGTFTQEALGIPMGLAWGKVGEQSAKDMLAAARALIAERGDTFSSWVARQLAVDIPVRIGGIAGARADGGPVSSGSTYLVGERGPELFTPATSGSITSNESLRSGGASRTVNITVNAPVGADLRRTGQEIAEALRAFENGSGPIYVKAS